MKSQNKHKEYPNSNDMMGCFLRTGFIWVRHVAKSCHFDPRRLGDNCEAQLTEPSQELWWSNTHLGQMCWRNPPQNLSEAAAICQKKRRRLWDQCKEVFGEPKNLLGGESHLPQRTQEDKGVTKLEEPWWNLGAPLLEPSTEPFGSPRLAQPLWNLGETSVQPWWNLPRNLLAAQDGSAPENQRHHETWRTRWNCGASFLEPWANLDGTLVEPSVEPSGSPRICPREP